METLKRSVVARGRERKGWLGRAQRMIKAMKILCVLL